MRRSQSFRSWDCSWAACWAALSSSDRVFLSRVGRIAVKMPSTARDSGGAGAVLVVAVTFSAVNMAVDVLCAALNPQSGFDDAAQLQHQRRHQSGRAGNHAGDGGAGAVARRSTRTIRTSSTASLPVHPHRWRAICLFGTDRLGGMLSRIIFRSLAVAFCAVAASAADRRHAWMHRGIRQAGMQSLVLGATDAVLSIPLRALALYPDQGGGGEHGERDRGPGDRALGAVCAPGYTLALDIRGAIRPGLSGGRRLDASNGLQARSAGRATRNWCRDAGHARDPGRIGSVVPRAGCAAGSAVLGRHAEERA